MADGRWQKALGGFGLGSAFSDLLGLARYRVTGAPQLKKNNPAYGRQSIS